ncbi:MAG: hypothetical protein LBT39_09925 [Treponema sp.]|nr:hypothetical protein [Treponema sp.]
MNGNGKGGNNRGKSSRRRDSDPRRTTSPADESARSGGRQGSRRAQDPASNSSQKGRRSGAPNNESGSDNTQSNSSRRRQGALFGSLFQDSRRRDKNTPFFDRPKWKAPQLSTEPIPQPDCPYCGKPIKDMATAIADKNTGEPVHFDCIAARIAEGESLDSGDAVVYIGGGRFGLVHFPGMIRDAVQGRKNSDTGGANGANNGSEDTRNFQIKKIFEWENKENRAPWRKDIGDHFSVV